jgi:hypothetical protein
MGAIIKPILAYLLLRDGHAVPIHGIDPDDIKASGKSIIRREGVPLGHVQGLNAVLDSLGFDGDTGDFRRHHWPDVQDLLGRHGLTSYCNLFDVEPNYLMFHIMRLSHMRRALADRLAFGPDPLPRRVFLGYGHDWRSWNSHFALEAASPLAPVMSENDFDSDDPEVIRAWVFRRRLQLSDFHNFVGDQLFDIEGFPHPDYTLCYPANTPAPQKAGDHYKARRVAEMFRKFVDQRQDGWVEIVPVNDKRNLFILKGPDGKFDIVWRNLRESGPPLPGAGTPGHSLDAAVPTAGQLGGPDFESWNYYRPNAWAEKERHAADYHCYPPGNRATLDKPDDLKNLERYLRDKGVYPVSGAAPETTSGLGPVPTVAGLDGDVVRRRRVQMQQSERVVNASHHPEPSSPAPAAPPRRRTPRNRRNRPAQASTPTPSTRQGVDFSLSEQRHPAQRAPDAPDLPGLRGPVPIAPVPAVPLSLRDRLGRVQLIGRTADRHDVLRQLP